MASWTLPFPLSASSAESFLNEYVLDSSTAVKWVLPEIDSDKADALRMDYRSAIHQLVAPDIFTVEAAHALTRAERQGRVAIGEGRKLFLDILTTPPRVFSVQPLLLRAIDISSKMRIGVYDCLYVALAEQEACELVTADGKLVNVSSEGFSLHQITGDDALAITESR